MSDRHNREFRDDERQLWRNWLGSIAVLSENFTAALRRHGIDLNHFEVLLRLSEADGHRIRMSHLAEQCYQSRSRLSHTIKSMERKGFIIRQDDLCDRRGVIAILTDEGKALLKRAQPDYLDCLFTSLIDPIGEDLPTVSRALVSIITHGDREAR